MATIDKSLDRVVMTCDEYEDLLVRSGATREAFDYRSCVAQAKVVFDHTIGTKEPKTVWTDLQERLIAWQTSTYGVQPFERQIMGIVEELGELEDAQDSDQERDGIADVTVFSSQLLAIWRLDLGVIAMAAKELVNSRRPLRSPLSVAGRACHVGLKTLQGIRGMDDQDVAREAIGTFVIDVLALMWRRVVPAYNDLLEVVMPIAEEVMKRTKKLPPVVPA